MNNIGSLAGLALLGSGLVLGAACDDSTGPPSGSGGTILVTIATAGSDLDPDGYTLTINNDPQYDRVLQQNDTARFENVPPGQYTAAIAGVAGNCGINSSQFTLGVINNSLTEFAFAVACQPVE